MSNQPMEPKSAIHAYRGDYKSIKFSTKNVTKPMELNSAILLHRNYVHMRLLILYIAN
jgi:hypothetical protein